MNGFTHHTSITVHRADHWRARDLADTGGDWTHVVVENDLGSSAFSIAGPIDAVRALVAELAKACGLVVADGERERVDHELACGSALVDAEWKP